MNVEIVEHADEMTRLTDDWSALAVPTCSLTLTYDWIEACARATSPPARLVVLALRKQNTIRAIAPLAMSKRNGISTLEFLGGPLCNLNEPCGFLYADEQSLRSLLKAVMSFRRPLYLDRISAESLAVSMLSQQVDGLILKRWQGKSRSLYVPAVGNWSSFEAEMSKSRRVNLKRKTKNAMKFGDVEFETVKPTPATFRSYLKEFFIVEASGWKGRNQTAIARSPYQRRFWILYCETLARKGKFIVFIMRINGKPIAMRLAAEYADRIWELKIGYDESYQKCSPGILLTHETIRYVFEQGLEAHEFLGDEEPWEHTWTNEAHEYLSFRLYPKSFEGLLGLGASAARSTAVRATGLISRLRN